MRKVKVYIASPYSNGNKTELVKFHLDAAYHLLKLGFNPFAPLYNHFIQVNHPDIDKDFDWLEVDKAWLADCDIAVRLYPKDSNGKDIYSPGADEEVNFCKTLGIPVFNFETLEELVEKMAEVENTIE